MSKSHKIFRNLLVSSLALTVGLTPLMPVLQGVNAASLTSGSVGISSSVPSAAATTYTMTFSGVTLSATKCIQAVFSTAATGGSMPTGMVTSGVTLSGTSTYMPTPGSWTAASSTPGTVKVTYATGETPAGASARTLVLDGITNGSTAETGYFVQFSTYNNIDCVSSPLDTGVSTFIYTTGQAVSLTVDPALAFTIDLLAGSQLVNGVTTTVASTDGTIPFGTVTSSANSIAAHNLTVTTNAGSGYSVYTRYTQAPTNGSHPITDWTGSNATPTTFSAAGTEAFGYTTNSTSLSGSAARFSSAKFAAFTTTNAEVAHSTAAVTSEVTKVAYQVGISGTTPAGTYNNSTVIFTATPAY